jgi:CRISPR-associated endonuclease Cas2
MIGRRPPLYLAVYDISDQKERDRTAKLFEGLGCRVQESVFELRLSRGGLAKLRRRLLDLKLQTGFILLYRTDGSVPRESVGKLPHDPLDERYHAIVL